MSDLLFKGTHCVITGAAGSLGQDLADYFAEQGAALTLIDLPAQEKSLNLLGKKLGSYGKQKIRLATFDIKNVSEIENFFKTMNTENDELKILINNAGVNVVKPSLKMNEHDWDNVLDTNLKGAFFMSKAVVPFMFKHGGSIVNIASQHGVVGSTLRASYCSSKGGLVNLTRTLALEWAAFGIRVNAVGPTIILNERNRDFLNDPTVKAKFLGQIPLGRYAKPRDVTEAVAFLASEKAQMITGTTLMVDGGWTAH